MSDVGRRLRETREKTGLSQNDFARLGGVTRNTQYNYETGDRAPDSDYLLALHSHGYDAVYILTGELRGGDSLTHWESSLVKIFRSLTVARQESVIQFFQSVVAQEDAGCRSQ